MAGLTERYSFIGRIFGMTRDRNMASCHRVLKGEFELRQDERVRDDPRPGSYSSISEEKDNVH